MSPHQHPNPSTPNHLQYQQQPQMNSPLAQQIPSSGISSPHTMQPGQQIYNNNTQQQGTQTNLMSPCCYITSF
jgi:hypothetical protein